MGAIRIDLPPDIEEMIDGVMLVCPNITEIWLIGSRAAGTATDDSDWDFLVFGDAICMEELSKRRYLNHPKVDLLLVYDGENFKEPWGEDPKQQSLSEFKWRKQSEDSASYTQSKFVPDPDQDQNDTTVMGRRAYSEVKVVRVF